MNRAALVLNVLAAKRELQIKSLETIQRETACAWASRAIAAYELFAETGNMRWLFEAHEYEHEALEHAALGPDDSALLELRRALAQARGRNVYS